MIFLKSVALDEIYFENWPEIGLSDDDPVYTLKKVMEELDFSDLLACYSDKGRTGFNPIMLYVVVTYANMHGVRAVDRMIDLCQRDLAFIWLTKGQKPKRDAFMILKGKIWRKKSWMNWITSLCNAWKRKALSHWKSSTLMEQRSKQMRTGIRSSSVAASTIILPDCWAP